MNRVIGFSLILITIAAAAVSYRIWAGGIRLDSMRPDIGYLLTLRFDIDLHGEEAFVKAHLPEVSPDVRLLTEKTESSRLSYAIQSDGCMRVGSWYANDLNTSESGVYESIVQINEFKYEIPETLILPDPLPVDIVKYLQPTDTIPSNEDEIINKAKQLTMKASTFKGEITALYEFVRNEIELGNHETTLDALTALRWQEAHCGGKSRLLVALLRASDIPARLKGGFLLKPGTLSEHHLWAEVWMNGHWVPLDPVEGIFAEQRSNLLGFFSGDKPLFEHSENINFRYVCKVKKWRLTPEEQIARGNTSSYSAYSLWSVFRKAHVSLNLLRILLLLPIAALIVLLARTVIGMSTLGTFLPALISVSFRDTGLLWGLSLLIGIILMSCIIRRFIDHLQMMHTARLAVVLAFVIMMILATTHFAIHSSMLQPASISMFPVAIMTIQTERIFNLEQERGLGDTLKITIGTIILIVCCYLVIDSDALQALIFTFPELLFAVVGVYLVLGRWSGIRLLEYRRFRWLLTN